MRPDPSKVLMGVAMAMLTELPGEIRTPFGQSKAQMGGMLNMILAQEFDRMADRLDRENRATAQILRDGLGFAEAGLAARIRAELDAPAPGDIRVGTLQAMNDRLRSLLIELHAAVEAAPGDAARALDARIWDELRESTRRRHVETPR